jgi:hypothetical protein
VVRALPEADPGRVRKNPPVAGHTAEPLAVHAIDHPRFNESPHPHKRVQKLAFARQLPGIEETDDRLGLSPPMFVRDPNSLGEGSFVQQSAIHIDPVPYCEPREIDGESADARIQIGVIEPLCRFHDEPAALDVVPEEEHISGGSPVGIEVSTHMSGALVHHACRHELNQL